MDEGVGAGHAVCAVSAMFERRVWAPFDGINAGQEATVLYAKVRTTTKYDE